MQQFYYIDLISQNIGFSPNGEGKNRILDPKGKNSCPSGEATWARNFSLRGQEFYSCPSHWVRILFLRISNRLEAFSRKKNLGKKCKFNMWFHGKITTRARIFDHPGGNFHSCPRGIPPGREFLFLPGWWGQDHEFLPSTLLLEIVRIRISSPMIFWKNCMKPMILDNSN